MTWDRFKSLYYTNPRLGLSLDISRMPFPEDFLTGMQPKLQQAFADMAALEGGAIANPDEKRMVGHYWLRNAELAPTTELKAAITSTLDAIKDFTGKVHKGEITAPGGAKFKEVLVVGIGGSALGPQLVSHALGRIKGGRVLAYNEKPDRQMCRLYLSMMDKMQVRLPQFGDAAQPLDEV